MPTPLDDAQLDDVLRAIAEPRRRAILALVADRELPAGEIAGAFPEVSRPAISQHLTVLRKAGLVTERRQGTKRIYRTRREALDAMQSRLAELWPDALARFKAHVESPESSEAPESPRPPEAPQEHP